MPQLRVLPLLCCGSHVLEGHHAAPNLYLALPESWLRHLLPARPRQRHHLRRPRCVWHKWHEPWHVLLQCQYGVDARFPLRCMRRRVDIVGWHGRVYRMRPGALRTALRSLPCHDAGGAGGALRRPRFLR